MLTAIRLFFLCIFILPAVAFPAEKGLTVKGVRYASYPLFTRIVFEVEAVAPYVLTKSTDGRELILSSYEGRLVVQSPPLSFHDGVVSGVELREGGRTSLAVRLGAAAGEVKDFVLRGPDRIVFDIGRGATPASTALQTGKATVIVLDPGHGGGDSGIVTAQGLEKTVTLDLAHAIKTSLQKYPRFTVVLTREKDQTLSLDERAAISNAAGAAFFVSIHAEAGMDARVFIEDLLDDSGLQPVQTERGDFLGFEAGSEQRETIWGRQQASHARQSGGLGRTLARQIAGNDFVEPIQAPLAGLKAVDAAAAIVELGMGQERERTAEAIAGGIERYVREVR